MSKPLSEMTREELEAYANKLETNNTPSEGIKIGEKGGVSVYGVGRFPVTLYESQWEKLFAKVPAIQAFIEANRDQLAHKPAK